MKDHLIRFALAIISAVILIIIFWYKIWGLPFDIFQYSYTSAGYVLDKTATSDNLLFWVFAIFLSLESVEKFRG